MGMTDKAKNAAEKLIGEAKESVGKLTDDEDLETEGKADQAKANLKNAVEDIKDAVKK